MARTVWSRRGLLAFVVLSAAASAAFLHGDRLERLFGFRGSAGAQREAPDRALLPGATAAYRRALVDSVPPAYSLEQSWKGEVIAHKLAVGDFNGDGRDDLAAIVSIDTLYGSDGKLYLYMQQPNGIFASPVVIALPGEMCACSSLGGLAAADFNEDGRSDLVLAQLEYEGMHYLLSQPGGGFAWRLDDWNNLVMTGPPQVADVDGDGNMDVSAPFHAKFVFPYPPVPVTDFPSQVITSFGDGAGNFFRHGSKSLRGWYPTAVLGKLNLDARPDLMVLDGYVWNRSPSVHLNDGAGGWQPDVRLSANWEQEIRGATIADLTGEGRADAVLLTNAQPTLWVIYPQLADGSLATQPKRYPAAGYSEFVRHADLDGDGRQDLLSLNEGGLTPHLLYYLADAFGLGYPNAVVFPLGEDPWQFVPGDLATGDFNHDGVMDVAVAAARNGLIVASGKLTPYAGPGGLPGAPSVQHIDVLPVDGAYREVHVSIGAPADDGGSAVTGYEVYSVPGFTVDADVGSPATIHRMVDLQDNQTYTFHVRARNAAGLGPPSAASAPVTLGAPVDPDAPPVLSFHYWQPQEGDVGTLTLEITTLLDKPAPDGGARFDIASASASATSGYDFEPLAQTTFEIPPGATEGPSIFVELIGDTLVEGPEQFKLVVSAVEGVTAQVPEVIVGIDDNDDGTPRVGIGSIEFVEGNAGSKVVMLPVVLSQAVDHDVSFDMQAGGYTADDEDFAFLDLVGQVIPKGQTSIMVPMTVYGDNQFEDDEFISITLFNVLGAGVGRAYADAVIINDDPKPTLSIADISIAEGNQTGSVAIFRAVLSAPMAHDVGFSAVSVDGSAKDDSDYISRYRSQIVIPAGETSVDLYINLVGDTRLEPNETFSMRLENPFKVEIADAIGVATIVNDDAPHGIAVEDVTVLEGGIAQFTVRLSEPTAQPVSFNAWTTPGTAVPGVDYVSTQVNGVVIGVGGTLAFIEVPTTADALVEGNESFVLNLSNVTGATVTDGQGVARIVNDDLPGLSIGDVSIVEGQDGVSTAVFEIRLSAPQPNAVLFDVFVAEGGNADFSDIAPAWRSDTRIDAGRTRAVFEVPVFGDTEVEPTETFQVEIHRVRGATTSDGIGIGTIINDDAPSAREGRRIVEAEVRS
jgi:hypothetical protein